MRGLALASLLAACACGAGALAPDSAIGQLLREQSAAWNRGDLEAFCSVYANDATFISPSGSTRGRQAVLDRYRKKYVDGLTLLVLTQTPEGWRIVQDASM
jgi:uncharacterized protein (TIGR02246 family)